MATARRAPEFVNVPGNGLDAFETESSARPSTPVSSTPLLEIVSAYPEPELCPAAWRTSPKQPFNLRRLLAAALGAVRAVVLFPFVVLSWFILRVWWLIRLALSGVWRAIMGTLQRIANAFAAAARGLRDAVIGAARGVARGISRAISVTGALVTSAALAVVAATGLVARQIAYSLAATGRGIRGLGERAIRLLIGAVTAIASAVRGMAYAVRRAIGEAGALVARAALAVWGAARLVVRQIAHAFAASTSAVRAAVPSIRAAARHMRAAGGRLPAWARGLRIVQVLAAASSATVMIAIGMALLSQPRPQRVATSAADAPAPVATTAPRVTTASIITTASIVSSIAPSAPDPVALASVTRAPAASVSTPPNAPLPQAARALSPATVRELWSKADTRSLDRALSALRSATLAFQRCEMRMTSDDAAVAHCDEAGPGGTTRVAWTIDFRRTGGHWVIDGLSATAPARLNR